MVGTFTKRLQDGVAGGAAGVAGKRVHLRMRRWIVAFGIGVSVVLLIVLRTCAQGGDDDMRPTVSVEPTFSELEVGDWGINVVQLQEALVAAGHVVMVDGEFGPQTLAAIMAFQSFSRLPVTGIVDQATATALGIWRR